MSEENVAKREREWLVWAFRSVMTLLGGIAVALIGWNLSITYTLSQNVVAQDRTVSGLVLSVGDHEQRLRGLEAARRR